MNFLRQILVIVLCGYQPLNGLKVLHMSFHQGCVKNFEYVAKKLNVDLISWLIPVSQESRDRYDRQVLHGNAIFDIGHNRAKRVWDNNKEYFNQFDVIVTSDTAPLARIFLQNGWKKPLIIWICNRFDYRDGGAQDEPFPDKEFYDLFRAAKYKKNVFFVHYTAYEHYYAQRKKVDTRKLIIKPCGSAEQSMRDNNPSYIPENVCKKDTFFVIPRAGGEGLYNKCKELGIPVYMGAYNGPADLKDFKGILHAPYTWSNLALFENIQYGLTHFVPSARLVREWFNNRSKNPSFCFFHLDVRLLELCEWYAPEHKDIIIYFDSWEDLKYKLETTDFAMMRKKVKAFAKKHNQEMIGRWRAVFDNVLHII